MRSRKDQLDNRTELDWWKARAAELTLLVANAEDHLPSAGDHPTMNHHTVDELLTAFHGARSAADLAVGAFTRVVDAEHPQQWQASAPSPRTPSATPPPATPGLHVLPEERGWGA